MALLIGMLTHQSCMLQMSIDFAVTHCDSLPVLFGAERHDRSFPSSEVWVKRDHKKLLVILWIIQAMMLQQVTLHHTPFSTTKQICLDPNLDYFTFGVFFYHFYFTYFLLSFIQCWVESP